MQIPLRHSIFLDTRRRTGLKAVATKGNTVTGRSLLLMHNLHSKCRNLTDNHVEPDRPW